MYPACKAHVPYCHLWPTRLSIIFPHYLILWPDMTFWFSQQLLSENFSFWNEWNLNFLDRFSKNNENPFSVSRGVQCRETDWQKGRQYMMKTIVAFCNFANTPKNYERKKRIWDKRIGISSYNVWQWEIQGMRKFLEKYNFSGPFYIFNKSLIN